MKKLEEDVNDVIESASGCTEPKMQLSHVKNIPGGGTNGDLFCNNDKGDGNRCIVGLIFPSADRATSLHNLAAAVDKTTRDQYTPGRPTQ